MFECCLVLWHLYVAALPLWLGVKILQVLYAWLASLKIGYRLHTSLPLKYAVRIPWKIKDDKLDYALNGKSSKRTQGNPCLTRNSPGQRFNLPTLSLWPKIRTTQHNCATRALSHDKDYWPRSGTSDLNGPRNKVALFHRTTSNRTKLHILEQQHRSQIIREVWCVLVMALWHNILWTDKL